MKIRSLSKNEKFIPEFGGNKDLDEKDQIVVNIKKFPKNEDLEKIQNFKFDADGNTMISYGNSYLLKNFVGSIKGIELDEGVEPVTNGTSLAKSTELALAPIIAEIRTYLLEAAEVVTEKES